MKHNLEFETGKTTCAIEPGRFCQFCYAKNFGTKPWCHLLDKPIYEKDGWLQRTESCMRRFPNET